MKTCKESRSLQQINLIFDRYIKSSLKSRTRNKRNKGVASRYKIDGDTNIEISSLKALLSHIETKRELTAYLNEKVVTLAEGTLRCPFGFNLRGYRRGTRQKPVQFRGVTYFYYY